MPFLSFDTGCEEGVFLPRLGQFRVPKSKNKKIGMARHKICRRTHRNNRIPNSIYKDLIANSIKDQIEPQVYQQFSSLFQLQLNYAESRTEQLLLDELL